MDKNEISKTENDLSRVDGYIFLNEADTFYLAVEDLSHLTRTMSKKFTVLSKQVKSLQFIIAVGCWAIVIEREQTNEKGLHALLEKLYLGDPNDGDITPMKMGA